jgi:hypothetical protein
MGTSNLRANPGGALLPAEVVGRDGFIDQMWEALRRQSVVLTAERRMGKTSVLRKMLADADPAFVVIKRNVQACTRPEDFVRQLVADLHNELPGILSWSWGSLLRKAGVRKVGISSVSIEFEPANEESWKDAIHHVFATLDRELDAPVHFFWDELTHMIASIRDNQGPLVAREVLDLLRATRETYTSIRMVFSGSVGLHHVVDDLRGHGGMWAPTHDMLVMDLPPLACEDATFLARELLVNERVPCDDVDDVAAAVALEVDMVPFYIHNVVHTLLDWRRKGRATQTDISTIRCLVEECLADPDDPWQIREYLNRVGSYYGPDADLVKAALDVIAGSERELDRRQIAAGIAAHLEPPGEEKLRDLLALLGKDHYLSSGPGYSFRLDLVRRVWLAKRA